MSRTNTAAQVRCHKGPHLDKKLRSVTGQGLLNWNFPPREQIIEPWLRNQETAVIWAPAGVGKTMMCLSLALAVAGSGEIGNWVAPKAQKVPPIDGEMNLQDLQDRLRSVVESKAVTFGVDLDVALENLTIEARQDQELGTSFYGLTDLESRTYIFQRINDAKADLVIFDNLTALSESLVDEIDAVAFKSLQGFFMEMKGWERR